MPGRDGTGPLGQGPRTGRCLGTCGDGMGRCCCSCGWGLGFGRFYRSPKNRLQALEDEKKMLLEELQAIEAEKEALKAQK